MGKEKYRKEIESLFSKSSLVSFSSISKIIKNKKKVKYYGKRLINELTKRGGINRLTKGYYTKLDEPSLLVLTMKPAYLGLQDALSFHNLWEQETIPVIITSRKVRQGLRKTLGQNLMVKRIKQKLMFGFDYYQQGIVALPYSDIEKTFLDMLYFKENLDNNVL